MRSLRSPSLQGGEYVTDINAAHQLLLERRVQIVAPPRRIAPMPAYDLWMMGFRDTEGNIMELMSEVPRPF